jgi:hypothetical protein
MLQSTEVHQALLLALALVESLQETLTPAKQEMLPLVAMVLMV